MKVLSCRDADFDCEHEVRAETEEELLRQVAEHAQAVHNVELTPELVVNFTVEAAPPAASLPESGEATATATLPLWLGAAGLLVLALGVGLRHVLRSAR